MKKIETSVTLARGGMHSPARYRAFTKLIRTNTFKKARLYHLVLKGSANPKDYSRAAEAIARLLRDNNVPCFGKGCWEVNEERGLHFHFMLVVEAQYGRVDWWLSTKEDGPLKAMLRALGVQVHIAEPRNKMHLQADGKMPLYAYVTKTGPKLDDALVRVSYLYKNDSKIEGMTRTYYSTREKAKKAEARNAEPVVQEAPAPNEQHTTNNEGEAVMTPTQLPASAHIYLMGLYESYVDKGLNVAEIKAELVKAGVRRTLGQVVFDLDIRYGFASYAETHPAPAPTYDPPETTKTSKPARLVQRVQVAKQSNRVVVS